jgi:hypothetical protein
MFEKRHQQVASRKKFMHRMLRSLSITSCILLLWLIVGIVGYKFTCHFDFYDSLLNASMIMSGMGPTNTIDNNLGKVFASVYAIFSGVIFITSAGVLLAPAVHRFMHQFHLPEE